MWDGQDFSGTKIALICGNATVAYLRDDKPDIPYPGMWDLPGGGREGTESPIECGLREVQEEFGLVLGASLVMLLEQHKSPRGGLDTYFCAIQITEEDIKAIRFGEEGQRWAMMPIADFIGHPAAVPHLRDRLRALMQ
jgi:8-oxo-dGTP diphosphatase